MRSLLLSLLPFLTLTTGCALSHPLTASQPTFPVPPPNTPLERSLFAHDPSGQLTEEALQTILAAPVELSLPARVGVLPILPPVDWRGPAPDYRDATASASAFAHALTGSPAFPLVTEMIPIPSGALGMEALREIAARYHLRYLILYREVFTAQSRPNPLASIYATIIGAFFIPGHTLETSGYVEATLFDVKTGLLHFTVRRGATQSHLSNVWNHPQKLSHQQAQLATSLAPTLATALQQSTTQYQQATKSPSNLPQEPAPRTSSRLETASSPRPASRLQTSNPVPTAASCPPLRKKLISPHTGVSARFLDRMSVQWT